MIQEVDHIEVEVSLGGCGEGLETRPIAATHADPRPGSSEPVYHGWPEIPGATRDCDHAIPERRCHGVTLAMQG
jgi:hypothetical protein